MWIFDGENWIDDDASESETSPRSKPEMTIPREEFRPELQVLEVVVTVPKSDYIPPFPMP